MLDNVAEQEGKHCCFLPGYLQNHRIYADRKLYRELTWERSTELLVLLSVVCNMPYNWTTIDFLLVTQVTQKQHYRVRIIDTKGNLMESYVGEGSRTQRMDQCHKLAIDKNGLILVVEYDNNRVIQLNSSLEFVREYIPGSVGLNKPKSMLLHEGTKCLYISEDYEKNITIFDV